MRTRPSHADSSAAEARPSGIGLRLYIAGTSERSTRAIRNAREICDTHFLGRCDLEVIDIFQQPGRARADRVLAVPTLIKLIPLPVKRFIGDLSDRAIVLAGLGVIFV